MRVWQAIAIGFLIAAVPLGIGFLAIPLAHTHAQSSASISSPHEPVGFSIDGSWKPDEVVMRFDWGDERFDITAQQLKDAFRQIAGKKIALRPMDEREAKLVLTTGDCSAATSGNGNAVNTNCGGKK